MLPSMYQNKSCFGAVQGNRRVPKREKYRPPDSRKPAPNPLCDAAFLSVSSYVFVCFPYFSSSLTVVSCFCVFVRGIWRPHPALQNTPAWFSSSAPGSKGQNPAQNPRAPAGSAWRAASPRAKARRAPRRTSARPSTFDASSCVTSTRAPGEMGGGFLKPRKKNRGPTF